MLAVRERGQDHRHVQIVRRGVVHDVHVGIGDERLVAAVRLRDAERVGLASRRRLGARRRWRRRRRSRGAGPRRCDGRRRSRGRPGPCRSASSGRESRERLLRVGEALLHFFDRRCPRRDTRTRCRRESATARASAAAAPRGSACRPVPHGMLSPWFFLRSLRCRFVMLGVMLADVGDRVVVGGREVADVEVDLEVLRHLHRRGEAFGRRELVRVADVRVVVHRHDHLVLVGERRDPLGRRRASSTP